MRARQRHVHLHMRRAWNQSFKGCAVRLVLFFLHRCVQLGEGIRSSGPSTLAARRILPFHQAEAACIGRFVILWCLGTSTRRKRKKVQCLEISGIIRSAGTPRTSQILCHRRYSRREQISVIRPSSATATAPADGRKISILNLTQYSTRTWLDRHPETVSIRARTPVPRAKVKVQAEVQVTRLSSVNRCLGAWEDHVSQDGQGCPATFESLHLSVSNGWRKTTKIESHDDRRNSLLSWSRSLTTNPWMVCEVLPGKVLILWC